MNAERWQAVSDLFERAVPLPAGERTLLVERSCGDDDELRREVMSLLASHNAAAGGFVQERIRNAVASFNATGSSGGQPARVGPYRLVRELGRGGMGTVFLAERDDDQYHSRVAVKLVRPGMDTEFILARFRRERQTLARLQHPNISRLLDGGTTDDGLPYIVMEHIDGVSLTEFARERGLTVEGRLRMFLDVCSAVDYAHRNFIVHRDLKPGNILVGADGVPKLLDFGICKLLRADAVPGMETVEVLMTPNYASPEQLRGEPVTLLSDVYSLGAVLYHLLTGEFPSRFESLAPLAIERALSQHAIALPSAAVKERALSRQLARDLDNILMRALETEPQRRYESAAQLADDLRRHLDHEPVQARSPTVLYRARKFVRRHRVKVFAAVAVLFALTGGLILSAYQARIAGSRLRQIRTLADKLVFDVHDAVSDLPGSTRARQMIVQTGLEYLDSAVDSARGDPSAEQALARAYRRLGDVQGYVGSANLGDTSGALARYRSALPLIEDAIRRAPGDLDAQTERLVLYSRIGTIQAYTRHLQEALETLQEGIRLGVPFASSSNTDLRSALAGLYIESSGARRNMGDNDGALRDAAESLRHYREAAAAGDPTPELIHSLSSAYASVGMSESQLGRLKEALEHFRQGAVQLEGLVAADPVNVSWNRDLMLAYGHVADVLGSPNLANLGDRAGALQEYRRAAEIGRRLYEADQADQRAAADYGIVLSRVETAMDGGDHAARLAVQRDSLRVLDRAAAISPDNASLQIYRALVNQHLGDSLTQAGEIEEAERAYGQSAAIAHAGMTTGHASLLVLYIQASQKLALNAVARARRAEALDFARAALRAAESPQPGAAAPGTRTLPRGFAAMGLTYAALVQSRLREAGDREEALSWLDRSLEAWRAARSDAGFGEPHRREMKEVEEALARVRAAR